LIAFVALLTAPSAVSKVFQINSSLYNLTAQAESAAVPEPVVPCLDDNQRGWKDPEFHSLRPYQASPCGDSPKAYFCQNDYTILEDVSVRWDPQRCGQLSDGTYFCDPEPNAVVTQQGGKSASVYIIGGQDGRDYSIRLKDVTYPVVGKTEGVFNSQSSEDSEAVEKMNEYVNWYLQGVIEKAEYGWNYPEYPNGDTSVDTFAGPSKKLLPYDILNLQRLNTLWEAGVKPQQGVNLEEYQGPQDLIQIDPNTGEATTRQTFSHNQIAVCSAGNIPVPCYKGDGGKASGEKRLVQWWEQKGSLPWETYYNSEGNRFRDRSVYDVWDAVTPPFPWLFNNPFLYRKAYLEWTGHTCVVLPLNIGYTCFSTQIPFCAALSPLLYLALENIPGGSGFNNIIFGPICEQVTAGVTDIASNSDQICSGIANAAGINLVPNIYNLFVPACKELVVSALAISKGIGGQSTLASLYEFIPLGNASDKNAAHSVSEIDVQAPPKTEYKVIGYDITQSPILHYPQTQSTVQVSKLLNKINTPLECTKPTGTPEPLPGEGASCCQDGYSFQYGTCVSKNILSACDSFGQEFCSLVNKIPNAPNCNPELASNTCSSLLASGTLNGKDESATCRQIMETLALPDVGGLIFGACKLAISPIVAIASLLDITKAPSCNQGLWCSAQGVCINPIPPSDLDCKPIEGRGTNYEPSTCQFTDIRTQQGDSLTFDNLKTFLRIDNLKIQLNRIQCTNEGELNKFNDSPGDGGCGGKVWDICQTERCLNRTDICGGCSGVLVPGFCASWPRCKSEVTVTIPTSPKIPFVDQLWQSTVIDKNTSFRRIFPKIEADDKNPDTPLPPLQCIKEIPASSNVTYVAGEETNLTSITTAGPNTYQGNGAGNSSSGSLFFPHLGTIYEYFLKGIQTILRPKGFGYGPLPQGDPQRCITESSEGACKMWLFETNSSGQYYYDYIIQKAESTTCNGKHLNPFWAIFIAINEDAGLLSDDAKGRGDNHFGCNQDGSLTDDDTIEAKTQCMLNTLRNDCLAGKTDEQTLLEYGYPQNYGFGYMTILGSTPDAPLWGNNFNTGLLVSRLLSVDWVRATLSDPTAGQKILQLNCPNNPQIQGPIPPTGK
jgi:hypothetical protein